MRKKRYHSAVRRIAIVLCLLSAGCGPGEAERTREANVAETLPVITRDEMIEIARTMAEHVWICGEANVHAACETASPYEADFEIGETVQGVAYDWGGMDSVARFDEKLSYGHAAGSHARHGVTACTAGVDCSGLVSLAWGQRTKFGTSTIQAIADGLTGNWRDTIEPGDAFNKVGSHIVLFSGYRPDGNPVFYEASGSANRVVLNDWSSWSYLDGYRPIRYRGVE